MFIHVFENFDKDLLDKIQTLNISIVMGKRVESDVSKCGKAFYSNDMERDILIEKLKSLEIFEIEECPFLVIEQKKEKEKEQKKGKREGNGKKQKRNIIYYDDRILFYVN